MRTLLIPFFACVVGVPSAFAELTSVERQIADHVAAGTETAIALLERTVNINSGTLNFDGVREVGAILDAEFETLGFATRWIDGEAFGRAGHLVAQRDGQGAHLLLIGHLDTVFEPDSPLQRFERLGREEARGPGTTDMKGGNVVMLFALRALHAAGVLDGMRLTVVMTGDEEKPGRPLTAARRVLLEVDADVALGFEDGDSNPKTAIVARRGSTSWKLVVKGRAAHSSQVFTEAVGAGAIYEAARILTEFRQQLTQEADLTFNPGVILGGTDITFDPTAARGTAYGKDNVVAAHTVVSGDIRALSPEQYERAKAVMLAVVANGLPQTKAQLTFDEGYPPLAATAANRELLALYSAVSEDLGLGPVTAVDPRKAGAADVSFVSGRVPRILDGLGLMGRGGHTVQEVADLTTLPTQTQRAALLIYRLTR